MTTEEYKAARAALVGADPKASTPPATTAVSGMDDATYKAARRAMVAAAG